jgi:hypothetical protein
MKQYARQRGLKCDMQSPLQLLLLVLLPLVLVVVVAHRP